MAETKGAYAKAGVDIEKGDRFVGLIAAAVKATHSSDVGRTANGYAGLYRLDKNTFIAATCDGVGTKLKLAIDLGIHGTVGQDLVAMSVNDLVCVGARPLLFLDYFASGKLELKTAVSVVKGIAAACGECGVALIGGETAEMPGMYAPGEYDLAGFAVGLVTKSQLLDGGKVRAGDALIGIASSGIHSNGYSLARKILGDARRNRALARQCLTPTKLYVGAAQALQKTAGAALHGMCHITGSSFLNIPRLSEKHHYNVDLTRGYRELPVFTALRERGALSWKDCFTTFNMGVGFVAAVDRRFAENPARLRKLVAALAKSGYRAFPLGSVGEKVARGETSTVAIKGKGFRVGLTY